MVERKIIQGKIDENKFQKYEKIPVTIDAYQTDEEVYIETLEGIMKADKNDWIIKGVKGEYYPCKPDVFSMTYTKIYPEEKDMSERFRIIPHFEKGREHTVDIQDTDQKILTFYNDIGPLSRIKPVCDLLNELDSENKNMKNSLEKIRHELVAISGLKAFDGKGEGVKNIGKDDIIHRDLTAVPTEDIIDLKYSELIKEIDRLL